MSIAWTGAVKESNTQDSNKRQMDDSHVKPLVLSFTAAILN